MSAHPTLLWLEPTQVAFARAVADEAGLEIVAASYPPGDRSAEAGSALGEAFPKARPHPDLRQALAETEARLALFLTAAPAEPGISTAFPPQADPSIISLCKASSIRIFSMEPAPHSAIDCNELARTKLEDDSRFVPLLCHARSFAEAQEAIETFGPIRTVSIAARGARHAGSLAARLFDAMHLLQALLGVPDSIDAAYVHHSATHALPPQRSTVSLRNLHGDLTANLRFGPNRAASLTLSSRAGRWFRGVTLLGDDGCIRIDESGFERFDSEGAMIDSSAERGDAGSGVALDVEAVAAALRRALDPRIPAPPPTDLPAVLAMAEAAILSAHTAQAESPQTILNMVHAQ